MKRKGGRPRVEMQRMDDALFGQLRNVVIDLYSRDVPWPHMAKQLTERTGVSVHPDTVKRWAREFREEVMHA